VPLSSTLTSLALTLLPLSVDSGEGWVEAKGSVLEASSSSLTVLAGAAGFAALPVFANVA